jgi:3-methylcrotonyl-CoA carboxylase alpha subunit
MFKKILIANRGEIAVRIAGTARRLGINTIAVYSDADRNALHVEVADEAFRIGPPPAAESYLNIPAIISAAQRGGAEAVHPGYGFLSENPVFVEAVEKAGLVFIGPSASAIRAMGLKHAAKALMEKAGVPIVPGYHGGSQSLEHLAGQALRIGYPVMIKASAGSGGKGMRRVDSAAEFQELLESAKRESLSAFGDERVLVEKYMAKPRHIEVQIFADSHGKTIHLFERDCSLQRRHQKVIEEAPAPGMTSAMRAAMGLAAVKAAEAVGYRGAGTVEFIADVSEGLRGDRFFFMEMNTRLQVEHPVTEMITGLDLVEWQFRVAAGEPLPLKQKDLKINGHAFEARLYAEDPAREFLPQTGKLFRLVFPGTRVDSGVRAGDQVTQYYDPMIAKIIVHGASRDEALERLGVALTDTHITGCPTNLAFLHRLTRNPSFRSGDVDTGLIARNMGSLASEGDAPVEAVIAASLYAGGYLSPVQDGSPFAVLKGFRLWGSASSQIRFETHSVSLSMRDRTDFELAWASERHHLTLLASEGSKIRLDIGGRIVAITVYGCGKTITAQAPQGIFEFRLADTWHELDDDGAQDGVLRAPMPGLVRFVHVVTGQAVKKDDPLVVTEAMKMEHALRAPRDGRVKSVSISTGDQIQEGAILVELEEPDA